MVESHFSNRLANKRRKIDLIDRRLVTLLNQRLRTAMEIGKIKKQMGMKISDPRREKEILERLTLRLRSNNRRYLKDKDVEKIFSTIIQVCRRSQK